ncbi:MAG TPA: sugar ABC transporter substrate-binding protein [Anaerolineae bacterium]|nr:sugar ABC transporter substrate-binding protein [Anaerolineae bacterium]HMR65753.1 sugar ABC transporter substrate-binding protein [Anaerolineae bacterium]
MKTRASLTLILLMVSFWILSCSQSSKTDTAPLILKADSSTVAGGSSTKAADTTIALVMKTLTNPFFVEMEKGARQAEAELGINLLVKTGAQETSIEQQIAIIKSLIEERVDAIVIAPADSRELIPVLKQAQEAGIVIINIDNQLDPEVAHNVGLVEVPYISVDNEKGAYLSAKHLADQVTSPTKAAILEGIRSAKNAEDRKNGALRAFAENSNIEVVARETANWKIDEAHQVTAALLKQQPDLGILFCANDMMALGAIRYLEETGRTDILVAAYDALAEAKEAIRAGKLEATIDQEAALQAYTGVNYAIRALAGEQLPPETIIEVKLVTLKTLGGA